MHNLDGQLKLSYSPMTIFEFDMYKNDKDIYQYLERTTLYVIAKRTLPVMKILDSGNDGLILSVRMEDNEEELIVSLLAKDNLKFFPNGISAVNLGSNIQDDKESFHSMILYSRGADDVDRFVMSANLDRLIHLASNGIIDIRIEGNWEPFISYHVLYVGKCVNEHIFKRFKAHHALQDILIKEKIIPKDYDKVNDLILLPFHIESEIVSVLDENATEEQFLEAFTGQFSFGNEEISEDCEKALVHAMSPKYNRTKFKQYPKAQDGLFQHNLGTYFYRILENLILIYDENNKLYGDVNGEYCSYIAITNEDEFSIIE